MAKKFYAKHLSGICNAAGCRNVTKERYCEQHKTLRHSRVRSEEAKERKKFLDTEAWRRLRLSALSLHPWCQDCVEAGRYNAATEVHHIAKRAERPDLALDASNLRCLCESCHAVRTARGE